VSESVQYPGGPTFSAPNPSMPEKLKKIFKKVLTQFSAFS